MFSLTTQPKCAGQRKIQPLRRQTFAGARAQALNKENIMKRITIAITATLILGALIIAPTKLRSNVQAMPIASPAPPPGCQNVKFVFKNGRPGDIIRIDKLDYRQFVTGAWHSEKTSFAGSGECASGALCATAGDNLAVPPGARLDQINLYYKFKPSKGPASWSNTIGPLPFTTPPSPAAQQCMDNKTYQDPTWIVR